MWTGASLVHELRVTPMPRGDDRERPVLHLSIQHDRRIHNWPARIYIRVTVTLAGSLLSRSEDIC
jgi:hypothetical protein